MVEKEDLNIRQLLWLTSVGGRDTSDVFVDENGFYVLMGDGTGAFIKTRLPK